MKAACSPSIHRNVRSPWPTVSSMMGIQDGLRRTASSVLSRRQCRDSIPHLDRILFHEVAVWRDSSSSPQRFAKSDYLYRGRSNRPLYVIYLVSVAADKHKGHIFPWLRRRSLNLAKLNRFSFHPPICNNCHLALTCLDFARQLEFRRFKVFLRQFAGTGDSFGGIPPQNNRGRSDPGLS